MAPKGKNNAGKQAARRARAKEKETDAQTEKGYSKGTDAQKEKVLAKGVAKSDGNDSVMLHKTPGDEVIHEIQNGTEVVVLGLDEKGENVQVQVASDPSITGWATRNDIDLEAGALTVKPALKPPAPVKPASNPPAVTPLQIDASLTGEEGLINEIRALVVSGAIRFVKGAWLMKLADSEKKLMRRQLLPEEAFWPVKEVLRVLDGRTFRSNERIFLTVSHGWLSPGHPDPNRHHLNTLRNAMRDFERNWGTNVSNAMVFMDFISLHQVPRTENETELFNKALNSMYALYAFSVYTKVDGGCCCWVMRLYDIPTDAENPTLFDDRGWTHFEYIVTMSSSCDWLEVRNGDLVGFGNKMTPDPLPVLPCAFDEIIKTKKFTSPDVDAPKVAELYRTIWERCLSQMKMLNKTNWTDATVTEFLQILPHFSSKLQDLIIARPRFSKEACRDLLIGLLTACEKLKSKKMLVLQQIQPNPQFLTYLSAAFKEQGRELEYQVQGQSTIMFMLPSSSEWRKR